MTSLLLIEDDAALRRTLAESLQAAGHRVTCCATLDESRRSLAQAIGARVGTRAATFDIVLLDLDLPDGRGELLLPQLRKGLDAAVLVISATHEEGKKIQLLDAGADDYLVKPFGPAELLARIRVAERHRGAGQPRDAVVYEHGGLRIDVGQQSVSRDGRPLHLTRKELQLLCLLARQPGRLCTHRQLLQEAWGAEFVEHTHYLRIYMAQLRAKLERNPADPEILLTETGIGYRLAAPTNSKTPPR